MEDLKEYEVTILIDASNSVSVRARTPEEAAELAEDMEEASVTLCHACAKTIEIADAVGCHVYDVAEDKMVLDTSLSARREHDLTTALYQVMMTPGVRERLKPEDKDKAMKLLVPLLQAKAILGAKS